LDQVYRPFLPELLLINDSPEIDSSKPFGSNSKSFTTPGGGICSLFASLTKSNNEFQHPLVYVYWGSDRLTLTKWMSYPGNCLDLVDPKGYHCAL
jgi:hypothetical protein